MLSRPANLGHSLRPAIGEWLGGELLLRVLGVMLQILATWALVRALDAELAGEYFRGFFVALGLSALVRAKYELYLAWYIVSRRSTATGISDWVLLWRLGQRVLLRSSVLSVLLLVVTADLDIQAPRLQPSLETYLPFVLALPCITVATLVGEALRAANRPLGGVIFGTCFVNLSILLAVAVAPAGVSLAFYSWAFFVGSALSATLAVALGGRVFLMHAPERGRSVPKQMLREVDEREWIGLGRAVLLWGPACLLAAAAPALEMAQFAVAARMALNVDLLLPALNLAGGCAEGGSADSIPASRAGLIRRLRNSAVCSSALVGVLMVAAPATLVLFGRPYVSALIAYALLLGVQWMNSAARPAVRQVVAQWDARLIGTTVGSGALAAVAICALGMVGQGLLAAAAASLVGAALVNARAVHIALASAPAAAV